MISVFDKKENCCGCTACKSICPTKAIKMFSNEEGFLYPQIDQSLCIDCGLCRKVCPFINQVDTSENYSEPIVYAVKHKNNNIRKTSTSGGVYTAISDYSLKNSGSVYGAKFDDNFNVIHSKATTHEGREKFKGSKYVQSDLKDIFKDIQYELNNGKDVLFTGTGCQAAGLKNFLNKTHTKSEKLIVNDIICHGTPSPLLWKDYLNFIQVDNKLVDYSFRYKEKGWRGYNVKAQFENGKVEINTLRLKSFTVLFGSDMALRPSCYNCPFANIKRPSDIMIGDFWGIEKTIPEIDDNKGISLVLISTPKGKAVYDKIRGELEDWESDIKACLQPNLIKPTKMPDKREEFWHDYFEKGFDFVAKKYGGINVQSIVKNNLRRILHSLGLLEHLKKLKKGFR